MTTSREMISNLKAMEQACGGEEIGLIVEFKGKKYNVANIKINKSHSVTTSRGLQMKVASLTLHDDAIDESEDETTTEKMKSEIAQLKALLEILRTMQKLADKE